MADGKRFSNADFLYTHIYMLINNNQWPVTRHINNKTDFHPRLYVKCKVERDRLLCSMR